jgi:protein-tyrosine-phosphatase
MASKKRVLILCTGNSARSQMAEGILRHDGSDKFEAFSAGTNPGQVRAEAIEALREIGIDISGHRSKSVDEFVGQDFDYVSRSATTRPRTARSSPVRRHASIKALKTRHRHRSEMMNRAWLSFVACEMRSASGWPDSLRSTPRLEMKPVGPIDMLKHFWQKIP